MKRVLQVPGSLNLGGAETMLINVMRNMDREQLNFDFVVPGKEEGYYESTVRQMGAQVHHRFGGRIVNFIGW